MRKRLHIVNSYTVLVVVFYAITALVFFFALSRTFKPVKEFMPIRFGILILFTPIIFKYLLHLLVAPWYPVTEFVRSRKRPRSYTPLVSVLIPAHNEEVGIRSTINSVLKTNYPHLEIVIINDGSTDRTHDIVRTCIATYRRQHPKSNATLQYRKVLNGGKARALNLALSLARGDILITIDADCVMDRRTIKNMVKHFTDPRVVSVAGNVIIGNRVRSVGIIQHLEYLYGFYFKRADSIFNSVYIVGGAAAAYRKKIVAQLGGFDENIITEDIELSTRLLDNGYRVRYAADAIVYTEGPSDIRSLFDQRFRWKYGRLQTFYKFRHLFFSLRPRHNYYLTFFMLPVALFAELLLLFEGILIAVFYTYTFYTNDFAPLAFFILLLTGIIGLQIVTDPNIRYHRRLFSIAPIAWILFYIMDVVEFQALIRSIQSIMKKKDVQWQRWVRVGVFEKDTE